MTILEVTITTRTQSETNGDHPADSARSNPAGPERLLRWIYNEDKEQDLTINSRTLYNQQQLELLLIGFSRPEMPVHKRVRSDNGCSALHYACALNCVSLVEYLLTEMCCDVNAQNKFQSTPLHFAASSGSMDALALLLQHPLIHVSMDHRDFYGYSPIHRAVYGGHYDCLRMLVKAGAQINLKMRGGNGATALHVACEGGHLDIVRHLVTEGNALLHARDDEQRTPLLRAISVLHTERVDYSNPGVAFVQPLGPPQCTPNIDCPHTSHTYSNTASAHADVVDRGPDEQHAEIAYERDQMFELPLDKLTAHQQHFTLYQFLLERDMRSACSTSDHENRNALHYAAAAGNTVFLRIFTTLANRKDVESMMLQKDHIDGYTPLHVAIVHRRTQCFHYMLEHMIPRNAKLPRMKDNRGNHPLLLALVEMKKHLKRVTAECADDKDAQTPMSPRHEHPLRKRKSRHIAGALTTYYHRSPNVSFVYCWMVKSLLTSGHCGLSSKNHEGESASALMRSMNIMADPNPNQNNTFPDRITRLLRRSKGEISQGKS